MFTYHHPRHRLPLGRNSASITIDLRPYVRAYEHAGPESETYHEIRANMVDLLTGFDAGVPWSKLLEKACCQLTEEKVTEVMASSINEVMEEQFVEIIKNTMDEAIKGYYENGRSLVVDIVLDLDVSDPEQISATLTDSGPGFGPAVLNALNTPAAQDSYIDSTYRNAAKALRTDRPELFGGKGRGFRILLADFLYGDMLESYSKRIHHKDRPPSNILFYNDNPDGGAAIRLTTTSQPQLQLMDEAEPSASELVSCFRSQLRDLLVEINVDSDSDNTSQEATTGRRSPASSMWSRQIDTDSDSEIEDDSEDERSGPRSP